MKQNIGSHCAKTPQIILIQASCWRKLIPLTGFYRRSFQPVNRGSNYQIIKLPNHQIKTVTKFKEYKTLNLPGIDEDILKFWKENNIFEKSISEREGRHP